MYVFVCVLWWGGTWIVDDNQEKKKVSIYRRYLQNACSVYVNFLFERLCYTVERIWICESDQHGFKQDCNYQINVLKQGI